MEGLPQDDFKWFGEGFDGFPKKLPEDVVEYIIFIIDTKLTDIQTRERLQAFQRALSTLEKKFLKEYIWQRESISLTLTRSDGRWMLKGSTNYGDSVADEWLIVYFLRELSKEFKDAWIRVYDSDGEFLLIEAANALPKWVNPEVAENRVWINNHRVVLIPMDTQKEEPKPLQLEEALSIISKTPSKIQHLPKVEEEAFHRLKGYPAAISENQHHATLPLPRKVAHILHTNPAYIAPAVEAFYLRDPISLRTLDPSQSKTALNFPPEDFVEVSVRFTKVLYAQLLGQNWVPPGQFFSALESLTSSSSKKPYPQEKAELAIKVTAGLNMLLTHRIYASKKPVREIKLLLEDLESGDDTLPTDTEISEWPKREDDEGWLNIDFSDFEKELQGKGVKTTGFGDKNAQDNLRKMVERFNAFIDDEDAGLEGAKGLGLDPMDVDNDSDAGGEPRGWDDPASDENEDEDDEGAGASAPNGPGTVPDSDESDYNSEDDAYADKEFAEYEKAHEKFMTLSSAEKSALTDDARALALAEEADQEEDEEIKKLTEAMEAELFSHGALNLGDDAKPGNAAKKPITGKSTNSTDSSKKSAGKGKDKSTTNNGKGKAPSTVSTSTSSHPPSQLDKGKGKAKTQPPITIADFAALELSEEEEDDFDYDEELLDDDYNLAQNMLRSFKGQGGMAGPAGNFMRAMGIQFPPDMSDDEGSEGDGEGVEEVDMRGGGGKGMGNGEGSSK